MKLRGEEHQYYEKDNQLEFGVLRQHFFANSQSVNLIPNLPLNGTGRPLKIRISHKRVRELESARPLPSNIRYFIAR